MSSGTHIEEPYWRAGTRFVSIALWSIGALILAGPLVALAWRVVDDETAWLTASPAVVATTVVAALRSRGPTGRVALPGGWTGALVFASGYPVSLAFAGMIVNAQAEVTGPEVVGMLAAMALGLIPYGCLRADQPWRPATGWAILWTVLTVLFLPIYFSGTIFLPLMVSMWIAERQLRRQNQRADGVPETVDPDGIEPSAERS